jgi:hypothetical protein
VTAIEAPTGPLVTSRLMVPEAAAGTAGMRARAKMTTIDIVIKVFLILISMLPL